MARTASAGSGTPGVAPGPARDGPARLAEGLRPYPDGWRAHKPYLAQTTAMIDDPGGSLPHYPVVSHRGGFPDGS